MAAEYRVKHAGKAVICDFAQGGWAFLCAGGSMPGLPKETDTNLLAAIPRMQPWPGASENGRWILREPGRQYLVYARQQSNAEIDLTSERGFFSTKAVALETGEIKDLAQKIAGGQRARLPEGHGAPALFWLVRQTSR